MSDPAPPLSEVHTPQKSAAPVLKTIPPNLGGGNLKENELDGRVAKVMPWIREDLVQFEKCNVDTLLEAFLGRCCLRPEDEHPNLLQACLQQTVKLANEDEDLRELLSEYSFKIGREKDRYLPLVTLANHALEILNDFEKKLEGDSELLRPATDILFHVNDPKPIQGLHRGSFDPKDQKYIRKPDVVVVNEAAVIRVNKLEGYQFRQDLLKLALSKPKESFHPLEARSSEELKITSQDPKKRKRHKHINLYESSDTSGLSSASFSANSLMMTPSNPATPTRRSARLSGSSVDMPVPAPTDNAPPSNKIPALSDEMPVPAAPSGSGKRSLDANSLSQGPSQSSKRSKHSEDEPYRRPHPIIQTALYATERMSCSPAITHAINWLITDDVVHVWWYDRQGAIQSNGINIVEDLPRFLVLLVAFQRFNDEDWGINPVFKGNAATLKNEEGREITLTLELDNAVHHHYALNGRATVVVPVRHGPKDHRLSDGEEVAKLFWPANSRTPEAEIIREAGKIGGGRPEIQDHIPKVLFSCRLEKTCTSIIRRALGIEPDSQKNRTMHVLIFPRYKRLTDLNDLVFWEAFWECFVCHFYLWHGGVLHRDISVNNLMYDDSDGKIRGILIDFDLATLEGAAHPTSHDRTGTIPFIALDLTTEEALQGKVEHTYLHDVESFYWVLFWIAECVDDGNIRIPPHIQLWHSPDYGISRDKRRQYINEHLKHGDWLESLQKRTKPTHAGHHPLTRVLYLFREQRQPPKILPVTGTTGPPEVQIPFKDPMFLQDVESHMEVQKGYMRQGGLRFPKDPSDDTD